MYEESKIASKDFFCEKQGFLDILDGLTAANAAQLEFVQIYHYCECLERKMRKVGLILTKLLFDKNFND